MQILQQHFRTRLCAYSKSQCIAITIAHINRKLECAPPHKADAAANRQRARSKSTTNRSGCGGHVRTDRHHSNSCVVDSFRNFFCRVGVGGEREGHIGLPTANVNIPKEHIRERGGCAIRRPDGVCGSFDASVAGRVARQNPCASVTAASGGALSMVTVTVPPVPANPQSTACAGARCSTMLFPKV